MEVSHRLRPWRWRESTCPRRFPHRRIFLRAPAAGSAANGLDSDSGKPLAKISVGYYGPARPNSGAACMMVRTKPDGTFEFHVPPGVSRLYVAEGGRRQHAESSRTMEVPADRDLVDVVLKAGVRDDSTRGFEVIAPAETEKPAQTATVPVPDDHRPYRLHVTLQAPAASKVNRVEVRVSSARAAGIPHNGSPFQLPEMRLRFIAVRRETRRSC